LRSYFETSDFKSPGGIKNARKELRFGLEAYISQKSGDSDKTREILKKNPGFKVLERELLKDQQF
jgi:hypothetical protein